MAEKGRRWHSRRRDGRHDGREARIALAEDFRHIDPRSAHILLFGAAPRILPTYPENFLRGRRRYLKQPWVEVHTKPKVERVDEHGVIVNGERIASRTVLSPKRKTTQADPGPQTVKFSDVE